MDSEAGIRHRIHEIKEAISTLRFASRDVEKGYRFDDDFAQEKIRMISQSVAVLEREIGEWVSYLKTKG